MGHVGHCEWDSQSNKRPSNFINRKCREKDVTDTLKVHCRGIPAMTALVPNIETKQETHGCNVKINIHCWIRPILNAQQSLLMPSTTTSTNQVPQNEPHQFHHQQQPYENPSTLIDTACTAARKPHCSSNYKHKGRLILLAWYYPFSKFREHFVPPHNRWTTYAFTVYQLQCYVCSKTLLSTFTQHCFPTVFFSFQAWAPSTLGDTPSCKMTLHHEIMQPLLSLK